MFSLFTMKSNKPFVREASHLFSVVSDVHVVTEKDWHGEVLGDGCAGVGWPGTTQYDYLISYISPWIIRNELLAITKIAAINFHPGPPEYPGIGCTNFALYDGAKEFGITVHHMEPKVDSGEIIMVKRFPVSENETVWTLSQKCYAYIFTAFCELLPLFKEGAGFRGMSNEIWKRKPYTRKELDALCEITEDMSDDEVRRRVRATTYPDMPGAYIKKGGHKFEFST